MLRRLAEAVDAWVANGIRYPFAGILYWPVLVWAARRGLLTAATFRACIVPASLALAGQILWGMCPYYLSASAIGFYVRMSLVWSVLFAMWLFRDERRLLRRGTFHAGVLASVVGFTGLSWLRGSLDAEVTTAGVLLITICSMFFGGYAVSVRRYLRDVHPIVAFAVVCQFVSAGTLLLMWPLGDLSVLPRLTPLEWGLMLGSSLLGIGLGHIFLYTGVRRVGASTSSGVQTAGPFVTVVLAMVFLGEKMSPGEWLSGLLMIAGASLLFMAQRELHEPADQTHRSAAHRHGAGGAVVPDTAPGVPSHAAQHVFTTESPSGSVTATVAEADVS